MPPGLQRQSALSKAGLWVIHDADGENFAGVLAYTNFDDNLNY